jgi:hypothetical protein
LFTLNEKSSKVIESDYIGMLSSCFHQTSLGILILRNHHNVPWKNTSM